MRLIRWLLFVILAATLAVGCSSRPKHIVREKPPKEKGPSAQELFLKANKQLEAGKWKEAIAVYDEALAKDGERWDIYMNRGIAQARNAQFSEALNSFEQALRTGGAEQPEVYFNLGNAYQERGMYAASLDAYRAGLSFRDKPHVDSLINIGAAYLFLRRYDEAMQTYQYVRQIAPDDPRALHGIGLTHQAQDQHEDAVRVYEEVNAMAPDFALSYFNKAWVLNVLDRHQEAVNSLRRYIEIDPDGPYVKRAQTLIKIYERRADNPS